jgi:hypothetical protein
MVEAHVIVDLQRLRQQVQEALDLSELQTELRQ